MSRVLEVILNKKQLKFVIEKSGEDSPKKAFNMFLRAMQKENIRPDKMSLLINKMMAKEKAERKE